MMFPRGVVSPTLAENWPKERADTPATPPALLLQNSEFGIKGRSDGVNLEVGINVKEGDEIRELATRKVLSLYDAKGQRKYLTGAERKRFLTTAKKGAADIFAFCWVLHETGCRISEALELTSDRIDTEGGVIVFESLKKRRDGVYRAVPVSDRLLAALKGLGDAEHHDGQHLWSWSRMTAYRHVKAVMMRAGIQGTQATAKGLRHGFAVAAIEQGIPLNLVQRWLGHADLATTAIYADAVGGEERKIAKRLWGNG